jgi:hypothetical protein
MRRQQRFDLGREVAVAAEGEVSVDSLLVGHQSQLLECGRLTCRRSSEGDVGQRGPTPQRERVSEHRGSLCDRNRDGPSGESTEPVRIDLLRRDVQEVTGRSRDEHARDLLPVVSGPQRLPDTRDETVQRRDDGRRWRGTPQLVDQTVRRHGTASLQRQQRDQRPRTTLREHDGLALEPHLQGPEDPDLEAFVHGGPASSAERALVVP